MATTSPVSSAAAVAQLIGAAPPLPDIATAIYADLRPFPCWIDEYVAAARRVIPTMPANFHMAAALWAVSLAVARRLVFRFAVDSYYPNLYFLYIASSGYGKSTSIRFLQRVLYEAELQHLLLVEQTTPESFFNGLSMRVPPTFEAWDPLAQERWLAERAFAAQRGWLLDEAYYFFEGFSREYMQAMRRYILHYYDCPPDDSRETQGGGRVVVRNIYPTFFGASTPESMAPYIRHERYWYEGLWARFVLLTPTEPPRWVEPDEHTPPDLARSLTRGLRRVYERFPIPEVEITEQGNRRVVTVTNTVTPAAVVVEPGVIPAWQAYRRAMAFELGLSDQIDAPLRTVYQRLATTAIKVAMLFAAADETAGHARSGSVHLTRAHYARAQHLVEEWRATLHGLWANETKHEEQSLADRILSKLRQPGPTQRGWTVRELQLFTKKPRRDIENVLQMLAEAGLVVAETGRSVRWTALPDVEGRE